MVDNILVTAKDVTENDRQRYYGHPLDNHGSTAALWKAYLERKYGISFGLDARDVCMMMILLKVSRDANKEAVDNLVDIAGYARNAQMVEQEAAKRDVKNNTREPSSDNIS